MTIRVEKTTPESVLLRQIIALARLRGWLVHHTRAARTRHGWRTPIQSDVGFPDLVCCRAGRVIFAELKSEKGRVTEAQAQWLASLAISGAVEVYTWRPAHW